MSTIGDAVGMKSAPLKYASSSELVLSRCTTGVEVELEGLAQAALDHSLKYWSKHEDGSLRHRNGFCKEFITPPIFGQDLISALREMDNFGNKYDPALTSRTSVHVHLDVRNVSSNVLLNMIILYLIYEQAFFLQSDINRLHSNFCVPLSKSIQELERFVESIQVAETDPEEFKMHVANFNKYSAVNIGAIGKFGSLEFRHHPGCYSFTTLLSWINSIQSLKKFALRYKGTVVDMFDLISEDMEKFTGAVFNNTPISHLATNEIIRDGLLDAAFIHNLFKDITRNASRIKKNSLWNKLYGASQEDSVVVSSLEEVVRHDYSAETPALAPRLRPSAPNRPTARSPWGIGTRRR